MQTEDTTVMKYTSSNHGPRLLLVENEINARVGSWLHIPVLVQTKDLLLRSPAKCMQCVVLVRKLARQTFE